MEKKYPSYWVVLLMEIATTGEDDKDEEEIVGCFY
jgi:hypothetical protein